MNQDQILILVVLAITVVFFFWARWRHDIVALGSLLACVLVGLVPAESAFDGFGHPAVITVAAVLVLSQGLRDSGVVDAVAQRALPSGGHFMFSLGALLLLGAILSAVMNNVGAMALLMPIAIQMADRHGHPPGIVLMPLAFATILGGMTTLIGTPPNLIVSGYRAEAGFESFGMFDFTPVGASVMIGGILLVTLFGWRLVPVRQKADTGSFDTGTYLTEVRITEGSKAEGLTVREAEEKLTDADAQIVGMVRGDFRIFTPRPHRRLRAGDIMVIEAEPELLSSALSSLDLKLETHVAEEEEAEAKETEEKEAESRSEDRLQTVNEEETIMSLAEQGGDVSEDDEDSAEQVSPQSGDEQVIRELVAMPDSVLIGQTAEDIALRDRYGMSLLAISRQGRRSIKRLRSTAIQPGDVLLLQGSPEGLSAFTAEFRSVPLAERKVSLPNRGRAWVAALVMLVAITVASFGLLPAAVAFMVGVVVFMVTRVVEPNKVYDAIDWPVIVLLGAMLPVADAMGTTGTADLLAQGMLDLFAGGNAIIALTIVLVLTMTLSDFMNNAATAAVMCPIALSVASQLEASPDSFLMAVAVGASCAMLTPVGHQNNTLILGPGGFRFGDYWRLGLPVEIVVVLISVPLLLLVWPL